MLSYVFDDRRLSASESLIFLMMTPAVYSTEW